MTQKFEIYGTKTMDLSRLIWADSPAEAIAEYRRKHPTYQIESMDGKIIVGYDEDTAEPIFDGDDYVSDSEGIKFLRKNLTDEDLIDEP